MKSTVALLGYGALSRIFLEVFQNNLSDQYELTGIFTRTIPEEQNGLFFYPNLNALLEAKPDYVLEFAGGEAVAAYGERVLRSGSHLILVSIGALADDALYARLRQAAQEAGSKLYLASGAIGGFDVLRTMSLVGADQVVIENRKAPASLNGAPYLNGKALPEDTQTTVFRGSARQAIAAFPKNVNVAVAAALAASDVDHAQVEIRSIPSLKQNTHIIRAESPLADVRLEISSKPNPVNPKSSTITAWSVAALLDDLASPVQFF